jgi:hypothetical protein
MVDLSLIPASSSMAVFFFNTSPPSTCNTNLSATIEANSASAGAFSFISSLSYLTLT